ncbi:TonB-dependent receptor [Rhizorhabdus argentea]|uniref:TonB-dependent receptor n=1 Tax=Rhizorhabdus argentea TaxID=1387174 RepID=UPI0030ED0829
MKKFSRFAAPFVYFGALAAFLPAQAMAQADPATSSAAESGGFQDIVVTARKRDERLQDVPVAITAFTQEELARYDTSSVAQLSVQTPQLLGSATGSSANGGVLNLRGVGSADIGPAVDQAVTINIDGIPISQANALRLGLHDLSRIEILKGPQALFYGKNSPGGIISITSQNPEKDFGGSLRAGYEIYNQQKFVEGTVSVPVTPELGIRLAGYYSAQSGWFINDAKPIGSYPIPAFLGGQPGDATTPGVGTRHRHGPNNRDLSLRGTVRYEAPGGLLDATLKASYSDLDQKNGLGIRNQLYACNLGVTQYVALLGTTGSTDCRLDRRNNDADIPPAIASLSELFRDGRSYVYNRQFLTVLTANFHPSDVLEINSVSGLYILRSGYTGNFSYGDQTFLTPANRLSSKQYSQEFRASTKFGAPINFVIGAYYQRNDLDYRNPVASSDPFTRFFSGGFLSGPQLLVNPLLKQKVDAYSVFGQAILDVTSQIQATAGGRYSHEKKQIGVTILPNAFSAVSYTPSIVRPERSFNNFSPELTLTYKPVQNLTLFAAYRRGFKSGGFDLNAFTGGFGAPVSDISYNQEKASGGEVGVKGTFVDRQVLLDLSLYNYRYTGLQVSAFNPATIGYQITNAGAARVKGVDLSVQIKPHQIEGLTLRSAIAYNRARYITFQNSPCYAGQSQAAGCNLIASGNGSNVVITPAGPTDIANAQDLSGRPLNRAPDWSGNVGATYERRLGQGLTLSFSGDAAYTGAYYVLAEEDPRSRQRKAWRFNASATLRGPDDRWELSLIGTNLTNTLRAIQSVNLAATGSGAGTPNAILGDLIGDVMDPRAVTMQATVRF